MLLDASSRRSCDLHRDPVGLRAAFAVPGEDVGVVPRHHDRPARPGKLLDEVVGRVHLLEVVHDRETGVVVAPEPAAIAEACAYLAANVDKAKAWGRAGRAIAERVTWDVCIDALLG